MATTTTVETGLETRTEMTGELATAGATALAVAEIQGAIVLARKFPRSEDAAFEKLMRACGRQTFAEDAAYSFPRGGADVTGPSVYLAREAARVWGNVRYGLDVIRDDEESRQIRGWAWDMETNTRVSMEDDFKKLIYRKKGGWIVPDERDLRELTNRRGAILVRNCLLQIIPQDLIEDALKQASTTLKKKSAENPDEARHRLITAFSQVGVTPAMIEEKLGRPLTQCQPADIARLRQIYKSIADGNTTWAEHWEDTPTPPTPAPDAKITEHQLSTLRAMYQANGWPDEEVLQFARQLPGGGVESLADLTASGYNVVCKQFATKRRETPAPAAAAEDNPDSDPPPERGRGLEIDFDVPSKPWRRGAK